jgi:hypothetical protein
MTLCPTLKSKRTRTIVLFFLLFLMLPISFQCVKTPLDFKAPQWSVPLNIQLIDRTFTFGQMIEKDPKFITDSTSHVEYRPTSIVNNPTPINLPELTPTAAQVGNKLGLIKLDVTSITGVNIGASQLFPSSALPFKYLSPPLPATFDTTMTQPVTNTGALYDYVMFENGRMTLTIQNNFPFTINFPSGVKLKNSDLPWSPSTSNDTDVVTFVYPGGIAPGVTAFDVEPISGKKMSANLKLNFRVFSNDIVGDTLRQSQNLSAGMTIDGGSPGVKPTASEAKIQLKDPIDVTNLADSSVQIVDDSTKIKLAEFKDGSFTVTVTNSVPTRIAVDFKLNEFLERALPHNPFKLRDDATFNDTVPAWTAGISGKLKQTVQLKNYILQSQNIVGGDTIAVPNVHFSVRIKALAVTSGKVLIKKDDSVQVVIQPQPNAQGNRTYVLEKVVGKVTPTPVTLYDTVGAAIGDIGNKFTADSINFDKVSITLKILSTGSFPTDLTMKIIGLDKNLVSHGSLIAREVRSNGVLSDTLRINPGVEKKIVFDKSTSSPGNGIDQFLSSFFSDGSGSLPQKFIVTGQALVDPPSYYQYPESTGTVTAGDVVNTSVEFKFPVRVGIISGTYKDTIGISDTSANKIDKKSVAQIDNGKVIFTINNTFPFRLDVNSWLLQGLATDRSKPDPDTAHVLLWLPKDTVITADSARYYTRRFPGDTVGLTGTVIGLTPDDIDKINPASFVAVAIKMNTARDGDPLWGKPVEFKTSNYVRLKAFVSVRYNVNFDKMK